MSPTDYQALSLVLERSAFRLTGSGKHWVEYKVPGDLMWHQVNDSAYNSPEEAWEAAYKFFLSRLWQGALDL